MKPARRRRPAGGRIRGVLLALSGATGLAAGADGHLPLPDTLSAGAWWRLGLVESGRDASSARMALNRGAGPATPPDDGALPPDPRLGPEGPLGTDPAALPSGTRAQAEPHLARNPLDPDDLLATFQEGRLEDGGAVACGYARSRDGGLTWQRALVPGLTALTGGPLARATDPVAAYGPDGSLYLNTLGIDDTVTSGVVYVSRAGTDADTFESPVEAYRPPSAAVFPDKNWLAVNGHAGTPTHGRLLVSFTRFVGDTSPIAVTWSDDGARTWSPAQLATAGNSRCQGSQPVFLPDGSLALVYWSFGTGFSTTADDSVEVVLSTDGGRTFGAPRPVSGPLVTWQDPTARDGYFLPSAAGAGGRLHVVYQAWDGTRPRVFHAGSPDGGLTWNPPQPVSDNPVGVSVFNPTVAASPDGRTVLAAWWDKRFHAPDPFLVDVVVSQSFDGGTTWGPGVRVTRQSTDLRLAPRTNRGYMLGDYFGLLAPNGPDTPAVIALLDSRHGEIDAWGTRFGVAPGLTFESWRAARWSARDIALPEVAGAGADTDGDGLDLSAEYAHGTDPAELDADRAESWTFDGDPDTVANLEWRLSRRSGATDVAWTWEVSADLSEWNPAPDPAIRVGPQPGTDRETWLFRPGLQNPRGFYRWRLTDPRSGP